LVAGTAKSKTSSLQNTQNTRKNMKQLKVPQASSLRKSRKQDACGTLGISCRYVIPLELDDKKSFFITFMLFMVKCIFPVYFSRILCVLWIKT